MTPDRSREDGTPEEAVGARDLSQAGDTQAEPQTTLTETDTSVPSADVVWVRISPSQVIRAVVIALLSAAVVLGALFLIWQVRTFVGWFVIALFLAAVLNPAVNWLQRRHRLIKRPLAILLTYLGLVGSRWRAASSSRSSQPRRPAQRAGDLHSRSGRRATTRHPRGITGHPGGRDHQDSRYRLAGLPARAAGSKQARSLVPATAYYVNTYHRALPQETTEGG